MPYRLSMQTGPTPGQAYNLPAAAGIIGRDARHEIAIDDAEISRSHARLTAQADGVLVEDLASTNGVFINGQRLTQPRLLRPGERLSLGETVVFTLERTPEPEPVAPVSPASVLPPSPAPTPAPPRARGQRWLAFGCGCASALAGLALAMSALWWLWVKG